MKNIHEVYARDLDLNLLRVFTVVAEEGSITRAASRLYVTQPAVSAAMRRLTTFVGAALFARQGRGVVLTSRGVELFGAVRVHLQPLVAATSAAPFDPAASTATVRLGLGDPMEALLLPAITKLLRAKAPGIRLIVVPVQFRTVEEALLSNKVDAAVSVADELPRSVLRRPLVDARAQRGFVCLYDPRFARLSKRLTEREYFSREHVAVSYAGDVRGVVEDALGRARNVRVSVSALSHVADVVEGSTLLATVPYALAKHLTRTRPHLSMTPLPFELAGASLELLWSKVTDEDAVARFVRGLVIEAGAVLAMK